MGVYYSFAVLYNQLAFGACCPSVCNLHNQKNKVWRWINATQSTVHIKLIAGKRLLKPAAQYYLKNIAPKR